MSESEMKHQYFLVTGEPGVGKTTLIKRICEHLSTKRVPIDGFYTEEVRGKYGREGFDVVGISSSSGRAPLAVEMKKLQQPTTHQVGRYGVMVSEFEKVAIPALSKMNTGCGLLVIDEIGKMEMFSAAFRRHIEDVFSSRCRQTVLATIPLRDSCALIKSLRCNPRATVFQVTRTNQDLLQKEILNLLEKTLQYEFNPAMN